MAPSTSTTRSANQAAVAASTSFTVALVSGGLAGTSVDTLFFPIDTLKTRAQSRQGFFAAGGFSGVYRGLGSAVVGSAPGASLFFTTYELSKSTLPRLVPHLAREDFAPLLHMASASTGEVAACLVRVPTEVVKQRSQTSAKGTAGGSWAIAQDVWRTSGVRGFYRGFGSTVAREIPFTCLQFPLYERLKLFLARRRTPTGLVADLPALEAAACGSLAGGVAAGLTTPLDVAKTRIMLSNKATPPPGGGGGGTVHPSTTTTTTATTSFRVVLRQIYLEEGLGALFAGVVPRVIWISAGGAVFLGVYEWSKKALQGRPTAAAELRRD
ncbi:S-adenosylmethionine transporter [Rhodotorula sp. JG-1b]|nr:S-adenosylmethionine transporter [Rhodotorula sp. JG-1b]